MMAKAPVTVGRVERPVPSAVFVRGEPQEQDEAVVQSKTSGRGPGGGPPLRGNNHPPPNLDQDQKKVEEVVAAWRRLSSSNRKQALALMALEAQRASPEQTRDVDLWSEAVSEALQRALGPSDGAAHGPQVVRRLLGASAAWAPVEEFLVTAKLQELAPARKYAIFRVLADLLVTRARRVADHADIPLTPKLVASNAVHLAGIFDSAFPGYLAAGLARIVATRVAEGGAQGG